MKSFLDQDYSIEQVVPEEELAHLAKALSLSLSLELAVFSRAGEVVGLWKNGSAERGTRTRQVYAKALGGVWERLSPTSLKSKPLPALGEGARVAPLSLSLELAGVVAARPLGKDISGEGALEAVRAALQSILQAHYRTHLASQMQVASTEQSYEDLESQNSELRRALRQLQTLDRLKGDFIANVNHELRTPLTAILGFTELLELDGETLTPDQRESVCQIREKAQQLIKLVGRVLAFNDISTERPSLSYSRFDLPVLVGETIVQHQAAASARSVRIEFERPGDGFPRLEADREKIAAVVDNLIENGVKFSPEGGRLRLSVEATKDAGVTADPFLALADTEASEILLHVADEGEGFSPDEIKEIFFDFHQLDSSSTRQHGGLGLGLALARRVVELHGGKILVDSAPGQGAHFVVSLPVGPPPELRAGRRPRALVVEDEAFIVKLIGGFLEEQGFEVLTASTAGEARQTALNRPLDLLLLDVRLPDRSGLDLLEDLRQEPRTRTLPVLLVTALADVQTKARAQKLGVREVVLKPFTREALLSAVTRAREPKE